MATNLPFLLVQRDVGRPVDRSVPPGADRPDNPVLPIDHRAKVHLRVAHTHPELSRSTYLLRDRRRGDHRLGRDASPIHTGAAERSSLDERHLAVASGPQSQR